MTDWSYGRRFQQKPLGLLGTVPGDYPLLRFVFRLNATAC
jgi:hypothetical protein